MQLNTLWSLRLGYSAAQADKIQSLGLKRFLKASFTSAVDKDLPECLDTSPKTIEEMKAFRKHMKTLSKDKQQDIRRAERKRGVELMDWWLSNIRKDKFPLREKMVCFWHNHFVATAKKVNNVYWLYQHNQTLRENAFGNFRELTRAMLQSNAVVRYLDNDDNKAGKINENLSRELLELFTLGVGNYEEADIKNGARALAGLSMGDDTAQYRSHREDNNQKIFFGKKGNWKVNDIVDIIFEQKAAPYLITRKILQWFIYDQPDERLVEYYGDYLREVDFEIRPLLTKLFTEEWDKKNAGQKIKDPLLYCLQLLDELKVEGINNEQLASFLREQGMLFYSQPNVKGWEGGRAWLTAQIYLQRNAVVDALCQGNAMRAKRLVKGKKNSPENFKTELDWNRANKPKEIIASLSERLLFQVEDELQADLENVLKYDFDPSAANADQAVMRLFNFICKTPEFQLV